MNFKVPGSEPTDPRYERFRDGFGTFIIDKSQYPGLRWAPWADGGDGAWGAYDLSQWDFIDFGVVGPSSPLKSEYRFEPPPPGYVFDWAEVRGENDLPSVFAAARDKYARYKEARPSAVWNPYDGSWREVRVRTTQPSPPPPGKPPGKPPRQIEYERKAAELKADYDAGRITDDVYKLRMLELNREYH